MIQTIKTDHYELVVETEADLIQYKYIYAKDGSAIAKVLGSTRTSIEIDMYPDLPSGRVVRGLIAVPKDEPGWYGIIAHLPIGDAPLLEGVPVMSVVGLPTTDGIIDEQYCENFHVTGSGKYPTPKWYGKSSLHGMLVLELPKQEEDMEHLAKLWLEEHKKKRPGNAEYLTGCLDGYKAASQGRMYSEEDMLKMAAYISGRYSIRNTQREVEDGEVLSWTKDYLQSLSPVQEWEFEPEMEALRMECSEPNCIIPCACYHQGKPTLCGGGKTIWGIKTSPNPEHPNNPLAHGKWKRKTA